jgi:transcriptional regulator with XRE-family HTH domain
MIQQILAENMKRLRGAQGLTQQALAQRTGISLAFLQNIEMGKRWVSPDTLSSLARALAVREEALFIEESKDRPAPRPRPIEVLNMVCEALGVTLPEKSFEKARVSPYRLELRSRANAERIDLSHMPEDLFYEMVSHCQSPDCEWEAFRKALRSLRKKAAAR